MEKNTVRGHRASTLITHSRILIARLAGPTPRRSDADLAFTLAVELVLVKGLRGIDAIGVDGSSGSTTSR